MVKPLPIQSAAQTSALSYRDILTTWWPLALSWLLMTLEGPAHSAVAARLADPAINLAAWGGIVFPLALIIESPIVMLLAASTALSKDWDAYCQLRRFMMWAGAILTILHVLIAFTPLYDVIVRDWMGAPAEIIEHGRWGFMIMLPWTWGIAYRRFQQGMLIRFGHSRAVGFGTVVRLTANGLVLVVGYTLGTLPGVVVAASAVATGVVTEAIYAGLRARPVVRHQLRAVPRAAVPLSFREFLRFYVPLALTSLLNLITPPIISAALSRMVDPLASLAVWPVLNGLIFILRAPGIAFTETVVALMDEPAAVPRLRRFAVGLGAGVTLISVLIMGTPLDAFWFGDVSALAPHLADLAERGFRLALLLPLFAVLQSWYQGAIMHGRRTRGITEAVALYLVVITAALWGGVLWGQVTGALVGIAATGVAGGVQIVWLWRRSRPLLGALSPVR